MRNRVKYLRRSEEFDISQSELARNVGVSRTTIASIESGTTPNLELAMKLAKFFRRRIEDIFFEDGVVSNLQEQNTA